MFRLNNILSQIEKRDKKHYRKIPEPEFLQFLCNVLFIIR